LAQGPEEKRGFAGLRPGLGVAMGSS
jgi:hypothetical protein